MMEKKINIDGLENRRYSLNIKESAAFLTIIFSIEIRKEYIWKKEYSEMYLISHSNYLDKLNKLKDNELFGLSEGIKFNKYYVLTHEEFNISECFEKLEENYEIFDADKQKNVKFLNDEIKPKQKKIIDEIMGINEVGFIN